MRKLAMILALVLLVAGLGARGGKKSKGAAPAADLKLAHVLPDDHVAAQAYRVFAEQVKEKSQGRITITIYANGKLGNTKQIIEQVQAGTLAIGHAGGAFLENFAEEYSIFGLPYLFDGSEHLKRAMDGELGRRFQDDIPAKMGLAGLMYIYAGARSFYTNRPVNNIDDLQGMKLRVQPSRMAIDMVSQIGATPTPMAFGEVYSALQQGVLDGAENNPPSYVSARHHEVSKYFIFDEHQMVPDFLLINRTRWNALGEEGQQIMLAAAKVAQTEQMALWDKKEAEAIATAQAAGSTFTRIGKEPFLERTASMYQQPEADEVLGPLLKLVQGAR